MRDESLTVDQYRRPEGRGEREDEGRMTKRTVATVKSLQVQTKMLEAHISLCQFGLWNQLGLKSMGPPSNTENSSHIPFCLLEIFPFSFFVIRNRYMGQADMFSPLKKGVF